MTAPAPKVLLFDLGGVVVPWIGPEALAARYDLTRSEVIDRFARSEIFNAYERGEVGDAVFTAALRQMFDLPEDDIGALWNSWVRPPFPGVMDALASLKTRFTTACLSNTNALHWGHLNRMFRTDDTFHHAFASHDIHVAKPDAESYRIPLANMGVAAEEVWFFEDTTVNVNAAREVGMTVHQVDRAVGVLPVLRRLGLISN